MGVTDNIIKVDLSTKKSEIIDTAKLINKRENHTSQIILDDKVIVAGGWNGNAAMSNVELFIYDKEQDLLVSCSDIE